MKIQADYYGSKIIDFYIGVMFCLLFSYVLLFLADNILYFVFFWVFSEYPSSCSRIFYETSYLFIYVRSLARTSDIPIIFVKFIFGLLLWYILINFYLLIDYKGYECVYIELMLLSDSETWDKLSSSPLEFIFI